MYKTPVEDILFTIRHVAGLEALVDTGAHPDLSDDLAAAIMEEAGRFADGVIAPVALAGDRNGSRITDGVVRTPDGWREAYRAWAEAGWNALSAPTGFGGQGLPHILHVGTLEAWNGACMAFSLCPLLTAGAIEAIAAHASPDLQATFLPKMVSGEWTGSMNLTEPHAGSDLGPMKTRAERAADGTYRIFGQKIFITFGEHDYTDNIIHLVLARLPDAPAGSRGISLFIVPKFLVNADGSLGPRNDVFCHSLEHKLGVHGSPTCTMIYGDGRFGAEKGAVGYLVGEENRGLHCMFTMMNNARLAVGIQGVAIADAATQKAIAFAAERSQGRAPGRKEPGSSPIIDHPDVARMLMTMKALTQASRAIAYACAAAIDMAAADPARARHWADRGNLLTPIAKSFATDCGVEVSSLGIQVHGGMGFIEETGAARLWRDSRIAPIYEGTNGIQAIDLVTRKLPLDEGNHVRGLIGEIEAIARSVADSNEPAFGDSAGRLAEAATALREATEWLLAAQAAGRLEEALSGATPYQRLFGLTLGVGLLAKGALAQTGDAGRAGRIALARFAAENLVGEATHLARTVTGGAQALAAARAALF